jgi:hypothetical protein
MRSLALASLAAVLVTPVARADELKALSAASRETPKPDDRSRRHEGKLGNQFAQIPAEYEAQQQGFRQAATKAESPRDTRAVASKTSRDLVVDYSRRMIDLAESSPDDSAARDALLWVINKPGRGDGGAYGDLFARAGALLVRHHGDDPEAVRIGLRLDNLNRYHIRGYPSVFVIDARGVIRGRRGADIDRTVDTLLAEMKQPASVRGTSRPGPERK